MSASFYLPHAAVNPTPGVYSLRHVGFLGAAVPAVAGPPPATFAAGETAADFVTVDFSEASPWTWRSVSRLLRGLREWIIEEKDQETADRVVPSGEIDRIADEAERLENAARVGDQALRGGVRRKALCAVVTMCGLVTPQSEHGRSVSRPGSLRPSGPCGRSCASVSWVSRRGHSGR